MARKPKTVTRAEIKEDDIFLRCSHCGFPSFADKICFKSDEQQFIVGKCGQCGRKGRHYKASR